MAMGVDVRYCHCYCLFMSNEKAPALLARWRARQRTESNEPLTQEGAAKLIGVSQTAWHDWEHGEKVPHLEQALKLAELTSGAVPVKSWAGVKPRRRPRKAA